jgi:N-acetylneuraminic acid mutarotase
LNDLFVYDPASQQWDDLTDVAVGTPPAPRAGMGVTSVPGRIFIFGGVKPVEGGA